MTIECETQTSAIDSATQTSEITFVTVDSATQTSEKTFVTVDSATQTSEISETQISEIEIQNEGIELVGIKKEDYANMSEKRIKNRFIKLSKHELQQIINNDDKYSSFTKKQLVDLIFIALVS